MVISTEAAAPHRRLSAGDGFAMWMVSLSAPEHHGKAMAWAVAADHGGGTRQPGELVADTLDELRAMMPPGLTRREPTPYLLPGLVETWE